MKRTIRYRVATMLLALLLSAGTACSEVTINSILNAGTTQSFATTAIPKDDITTILQAGLAATSAINQQPWYFAVVTNQQVMDDITGSMRMGGAPSAPAGAPADASGGAPAGAPANMPPVAPAGTSAKATLGDSPVAIIIYMDKSTASANPAFDCGLACQNMVVAATMLGYGTKIVSSPTMALNGDKHDILCQILGVDISLSAIAVLLVGYRDDSTDAVTNASVRNALEEKVSFVE